MSKYALTFTTTIKGRVTVEAETAEEAERIGEEMAMDTLNYEDLSDHGQYAPDAETEFDDIYEVKQ